MSITFNWQSATPHQKQVYANSLHDFIVEPEKKPSHCDDKRDGKAWWKSISQDEKDAYLERIGKFKEMRKRGSKVVYMPPQYSKIGDCECSWTDYYRIYPNGKIEADYSVKRRLKRMKKKG